MARSTDIVIIGAGAAGVAAARHLASSGRSILVLEASARIGGRAHTVGLGGMKLDLGCGWLHSGERNVWREIAEQAGVPVDRTPTAWRQQYADLGFPAADAAAAEASWASWSERLERAAWPSDCAADALRANDPWNAFIQALSGYINGAALERVSVADYLAYDRAASDTNWRLPDGYGSLVAASLPPVPLRLATHATAIGLSGSALRVETPAGAIQARAAIVTLSTNALVAGGLRLAPALDDHLHAASCLPLGLADKLFLAIDDAAGPNPFAPETHVIGNPRDADTGGYYIRPFGHPVIECFYGGPGAERIERAGLHAAFAHAIDELAALFGRAAVRCLRPLAGSCWGLTDGIGGSYSHALPGQAVARAVLAAPYDNRIFFAGEATHATDFSTAHGAHETGRRAAAEVLQALA